LFEGSIKLGRFPTRNRSVSIPLASQAMRLRIVYLLIRKRSIGNAKVIFFFTRVPENIEYYTFFRGRKFFHIIPIRHDYRWIDFENFFLQLIHEPSMPWNTFGKLMGSWPVSGMNFSKFVDNSSGIKFSERSDKFV
jgi:hypothetical protein